jgi:hypothetical protein
MSQHASLTPERWAAFSRDQQLLAIANEMNRASRMVRLGDNAGVQRCYERILRLVDLTVEVNPQRSLRRELLRWRDLAAELYLEPLRAAECHPQLFRALLQLTPAAARQIPFVLASA